jgi:hypothetical protein
MALTLKTSTVLASNAKSVNIYDTTKPYAAGNTGGYGTPNPAIGDAAVATVAVWVPLSTTNLPALTSAATVTVNVYPTLPNIASAPYNITNSVLGQGTSTLPDGYYFTYTVSGTQGATPFSATVSCYKFFTYNIRCCLDRWNARLGCGCSGDKQDLYRYKLAELRYMSMMNDIFCTNVTRAAEKLLLLQNMCPSDCGCS